MKNLNDAAKFLALIAFITFTGVIIVTAADNKTDENADPAARRQSNRQRVEGQNSFAGPGRFAPGFERLFSILTEEQRASLREAMQSQREKMREAEEKLRDARREIFELGLKEKFDEEAVREKALAAAKLDAEVTVLRAKAFSQMRPALSAEQIEKLKNLPPPGSETQGQSQRPRRRPEVQRDENGLPPKDRVPAGLSPTEQGSFICPSTQNSLVVYHIPGNPCV